MMNPYYGSSSFGSPPSLVSPPSHQLIHPHHTAEVNDSRGRRMLPHNHHHLSTPHNGMAFTDGLFSRPFYGSDLIGDNSGVGGGYGEIDGGMLRGDYTDRLNGMGSMKSFSNHSMMIPHLRRNQSMEEGDNGLDGRTEDDVMEGRYNPHSLMRTHLSNNGLQGMHNNTNNNSLMAPMSHLSGMTHHQQPPQPHHPLLDDSYDSRLNHSLNPPSGTSATPASRFMSPHQHNTSPWRQSHLLSNNHNTPPSMPTIHSPNNTNNNNVSSPLRSQPLIQSTKSDDQYSTSPTNTSSIDINNTASTATTLNRNTTTNASNTSNNTSNTNSNSNVPFYPWMSVVG